MAYKFSFLGLQVLGDLHVMLLLDLHFLSGFFSLANGWLTGKVSRHSNDVKQQIWLW